MTEWDCSKCIFHDRYGDDELGRNLDCRHPMFARQMQFCPVILNELVQRKVEERIAEIKGVETDG